MSFEDPWFREGKSMSPLDAERGMYEHTKNPIHAWRALGICSELMRAGTYGCDTLPDWLLDYVDTSSAGVRQLFDNAGEIAHALMAAHLADALGFKRTGQGVRTMAGSNAAVGHRQRALARMVWNRKRDHPTSSIESIAIAIEARLGASAALFEQGKQDGNIPASERPNEHEIRASQKVIEDAWREWHDVLEDEWGTLC
jgi:hypothetical protein